MNENRVHPNYQGMLKIGPKGPPKKAVSETQAKLLEMDPGARHAHDASDRVYRRGGNEGHFTEEALEVDGEPHPLDESDQS